MNATIKLLQKNTYWSDAYVVNTMRPNFFGSMVEYTICQGPLSACIAFCEEYGFVIDNAIDLP